MIIVVFVHNNVHDNNGIARGIRRGVSSGLRKPLLILHSTWNMEIVLL